MNMSGSKRFLVGRTQNIVKGDNKVFDISNANVIFTGDSEQAAMVAVGYNHYYCLPNKQLKYFVMNFKSVFQSIQDTNGASYNLHTDELNPSTGYMVAIPGFEKKYDIPTDHNKFQDVVISYVINRDLWDKIATDPDNIYLGFWLNDGKLYIDIAENISNKKEAILTGYSRNQIAIYDCINKEDIKIPVFNTDPIEFTNIQTK